MLKSVDFALQHAIKPRKIRYLFLIIRIFADISFELFKQY